MQSLKVVVKKSANSTIESSTDAATKQYAKAAMERSVELQKTLVDTAFQNPPSAASVVGLPQARWLWLCRSIEQAQRFTR